MKDLKKKRIYVEVYQEFSPESIINMLKSDLSYSEIPEFIAELAKKCDNDWSIYEKCIQHFEAVKQELLSQCEDEELDFTPHLLTKGI